MNSNNFLVTLQLLLFACLICSASSCFADILVISSNGENKALLIDPGTFKLIASLETGEGPHDIAISPDGRYAHVAITGSNESPGNTITVIDVSRREIKSTFPLNTCKQPHDLKFTSDGKVLFVTCAPSRNVIEVDAANGEVLKEWQVDQEGAWMLAITPDDRKIFTANIEGRSVTIIDRKKNRIHSIPFDSGQIGIDVSPDGREVWVHHTDTSQISIIETGSEKILETISSEGKGFGRVKFTPDGKYVLVPQSHSKNLAIFERSTRKLVKSVPLSASPKVITVSRDNKRAFITAPGANRTIVVDLEAWEEIASHETGITPDGIAYCSEKS